MARLPLNVEYAVEFVVVVLVVLERRARSVGQLVSLGEFLVELIAVEGVVALVDEVESLLQHLGGFGRGALPDQITAVIEVCQRVAFLRADMFERTFVIGGRLTLTPDTDQYVGIETVGFGVLDVLSPDVQRPADMIERSGIIPQQIIHVGRDEGAGIEQQRIVVGRTYVDDFERVFQAVGVVAQVMGHRYVVQNDRIGVFVGALLGILERFHEVRKPFEVVHLHLRGVDGQRIVDRSKCAVILQPGRQIERTAVIVLHRIADFARQRMSCVDQAVERSFAVVPLPPQLQQPARDDGHFVEIPLFALAGGVFDQRIDIPAGRPEGRCGHAVIHMYQEEEK